MTLSSSLPFRSRLDIDAALAHLATADPVMRELATRHRPHAPRPDRSHFHLLASAIIAQQISGKAADAIMARVLALVAPDGGELTPALVLRHTQDALRGAGVTRQKAGYILGIAEACASGALDLDGLAALDDTEAIEALVAMKGIGPWTAEMHLLFVLERPDVLSCGDLGIRTAVKRLYGLDALPTADELRGIAAPWSPHRSTAMLLLWASHDSPPVQALTGAAFAPQPTAPFQPGNLFW